MCHSIEFNLSLSLLLLAFVFIALCSFYSNISILHANINGINKREFNGFFFFLSGVEEWGGQCRNGRRQSPIDLAKDAAVMGRYPSLYFRNYDSSLVNAKIRNTGHSCKYINSYRFIFNTIRFSSANKPLHSNQCYNKNRYQTRHNEL